ncbi:MAG: preprotein translocase subunit SecG [Pseudomonadota bacterium]
MDTVTKAVWIAHTLIALLIIVLVLLQRGKGADAGAAFGAGASGTVFGARGTGNFFSRMTAIFATLFFVTSLSLAYLSSQAASGPESLLEDLPAETQDDVDEAPALDDELPALDDAAPAADDGEMPSLVEPAEPASDGDESG